LQYFHDFDKTLTLFEIPKLLRKTYSIVAMEYDIALFLVLRIFQNIYQLKYLLMWLTGIKDTPFNYKNV